ncbi:hypothetical protein SHKM778_95730 (plasmid) [Streptomyces sp. KM77-8]|uniref:Uncharacterized protein n=1 Tax=Streptomyces haneummycinicus TaxID=3074435 RepID=A0AAT9HZV7_9ACTN
MAVDEVDEGLEVASGGVVGGIVLQLAPGGEQHEFRVCGAAAALEVAGSEGELGQLVLAAGEGDAVAGGEQAQDLGHGADVGPAQHRGRAGRAPTSVARSWLPVRRRGRWPGSATGWLPRR